MAMAAAIVLFSMVAGAQDKDGKKLYRWVDKEGKVHYDDALPPEAVDQARQEISATRGTVTGTVDRALTPEEHAQRAAEQKRAAELATQAEQQARMEESLLTSYQTEADLRRAYTARITLLEQTLESTGASLGSLRETIASVIAQASDAELEGRPVDPKQSASITELRAELLKQQRMQRDRRAELTALRAEYERLLGRFRQLHAATAPRPPDPPAAQAKEPAGEPGARR